MLALNQGHTGVAQRLEELDGAAVVRLVAGVGPEGEHDRVSLFLGAGQDAGDAAGNVERDAPLPAHHAREVGMLDSNDLGQSLIREVALAATDKDPTNELRGFASP